jgi:hypothetical protein
MGGDVVNWWVSLHLLFAINIYICMFEIGIQECLDYRRLLILTVELK